jgi:hypothetical protein
MPIYMNWGLGAVRGSVRALGYDSWIEVASFQFEGQTYTGATGKKSPSGQLNQALNSISLLVADPGAALLFLRLAAGQQASTRTVTIVVVRPSKDMPSHSEEILKVDLWDVSVTAASLEGRSAAVTLYYHSFERRYS